MTKEEVFCAVFGLLFSVSVLIGYYFYIRALISGRIPDAIADSERPGFSGKEKLEDAVSLVYVFVPKILRPIITRSYVEKLINAAFEKIEEFAEKQ